MTILGVTASSILKVSGAFDSIATVNGNGTSSTLTFSSIPSTYRHLQLRGIARGDGASTGNGAFLLRFNGDNSSLNYTYHAIGSQNTAAYNQGTATGSYAGAYVNNTMPGDSLTSGIFSAFIIDIHDYATTSKNRTIRSQSTILRNDTSTILMFQSSWWGGTSAINTIDIVSAQGWNFVTGSTISLYGIAG